MRWLLLTGLGLLAVLGVVFYQRKKSATTFNTYTSGLEPPPPPPAPSDWTGTEHPSIYSSANWSRAQQLAASPNPLDPYPTDPAQAMAADIRKGWAKASDDYDSVVLIDPDSNGAIGMGEQMTAANMVKRYGIDKAKGLIGFYAKNRPSPLTLPILSTPKENNQVSTAWGGSIGYFETIKFASGVGAKLLALFPPTRGIAAGYVALSNRLEPPPPPPISG